MFYTYILRSLSQPEQRYIGSTSDLKSRLIKHNSGEVPHTSKFKPWKIEAYFAFETKEKAENFKSIMDFGMDAVGGQMGQIDFIYGVKGKVFYMGTEQGVKDFF